VYSLRKWLLTYVGFLGSFCSLIALLLFSFSDLYPILLTLSLYSIVIMATVPFLLILIHPYCVRKQVNARRDTIEKVATEILNILQSEGSDKGIMVSELKGKLHRSCQPYIQAALKYLFEQNLIERVPK